MMTALEPILIHLTAPAPLHRQQEPVTLGIPFPAGALQHPEHLHLVHPSGKEIALQTAVLDRWKDGSIRWLLADFQAELAGEAHYQLVYGSQIRTAKPRGALSLSEEELGCKIQNSQGEFSCRP
ncbi:MAG TPA: hypothetical protein PKD72_12810, partial [Gemmatales bacterium]|nr:hypothetical protein [Gemmatales bacterium]